MQLGARRHPAVAPRTTPESKPLLQPVTPTGTHPQTGRVRFCFRDYQEAFSETTDCRSPCVPWRIGNSPTLASKTLLQPSSPEATLLLCGLPAMQQQALRPPTACQPLKCAFGLNETAVTVKLGDRTIGICKPGRSSSRAPPSPKTTDAISRLRKTDATVNAREATAAYQATRVVRRRPMIPRSACWNSSPQLSLMANPVTLLEQPPSRLAAAQARQFIHEHSADEISLGDVARHAAMSPFYLQKFSDGTSLHGYVARARGKLRELLQSESSDRWIAFQNRFPIHRRISTVASNASPANRPRLVGKTPIRLTPYGHVTTHSSGIPRRAPATRAPGRPSNRIRTERSLPVRGARLLTIGD